MSVDLQHRESEFAIIYLIVKRIPCWLKWVHVIWERCLFLKRTFFLLIMLLIGLFGCTDAELTEPQVVVTEVIDAFYAKAPKNRSLSVKERYERIAAHMDVEEQKEGVINYLKESEQEGMTGVYYVAENPSEPQTESTSFQLVKLMKSSFPRSAENEFGEAESIILGVSLQRIDGEWKIHQMDQSEEPEKKIEWIKVKPYE